MLPPQGILGSSGGAGSKPTSFSKFLGKPTTLGFRLVYFKAFLDVHGGYQGFDPGPCDLARYVRVFYVFFFFPVAFEEHLGAKNKIT